MLFNLLKKSNPGIKVLGAFWRITWALGKPFRSVLADSLDIHFLRVIHSLYVATIVPMAINYVLELDRACQSTSTSVLVFSYL